MTGAESLVRTLLGNGVEVCFANPGTSEMHFVGALDEFSGMRCVLGLQENIVTGMADGYYRVLRKPACTLLHCGPGLANGLANLHNARRAYSGIVNIVGDQATYHRPLDPPLTADTQGFARGVSNWVRTCATPEEVGSAAAEAVRVASEYPGHISTLILPSDTSWGAGGVAVAVGASSAAPRAASGAAIARGAEILATETNVLLLLGGGYASEHSQKRADAIARRFGADLMVDHGTARVARGMGRPPLERVPYDLGRARERLAGYTHILLIGARAPIGFFAYPGRPNVKYAEGTELHVVARPDEDMAAALDALADALGLAPTVAQPAAAQQRLRADQIDRSITPATLAQAIALTMPKDSIVVDESITYGARLYEFTYGAAPHDWFHMVGGAIGGGPPIATGAAVAAGRRRRVINIQADGAAMYTPQALWTQAHERLPVTTIVIDNKKYNILLKEYQNVGASPGTSAKQLFDLDQPAIGWCRLAESMGVEAVKAGDTPSLIRALAESFESDLPVLIDLEVSV